MRVAEQQTELDSLRQTLQTQKTRAEDLDSHNCKIQAENNTVNETVKEIEEQIEALQSDKEASRMAAEDLVGSLRRYRRRTKPKAMIPNNRWA